MTDKVISPLRRRLIETWRSGGLAPRRSTNISATSKGLPISWASLPPRPPPRTSIASSCGWRRSERRYRPSTSVPLPCGSSSRSRRGATILPRRSSRPAGHAASLSFSARKRWSAARVGDQHQAQGGPEPDLCHRPSVIGGRVAEQCWTISALGPAIRSASRCWGTNGLSWLPPRPVATSKDCAAPCGERGSGRSSSKKRGRRSRRATTGQDRRRYKRPRPLPDMGRRGAGHRSRQRDRSA